jgi:hypothetical protein
MAQARARSAQRARGTTEPRRTAAANAFIAWPLGMDGSCGRATDGCTLGSPTNGRARSIASFRMASTRDVTMIMPTTATSTSGRRCRNATTSPIRIQMAPPAPA